MADSVRMMDLAALTRGLEEFRRLDPEQRVLAHRLATQAAVKRMEEVHKDVESADHLARTQVRPRDPEEERRRGQGRPEDREAAPGEEREPETVPERHEGRLLDIKA